MDGTSPQYQPGRSTRRSLVYPNVLTLALQKTDRGNRSCPTSSTQNPRLNPHSIRGTASAPLPAISCLGAFRTPVAGARGWHPIPASENLHNSCREQVQQTTPLFDHLVGGHEQSGRHV